MRGDVGTWLHAARFVLAIWDAHSPAGPAVTSLLGDLAAVAETFQRYRRATYTALFTHMDLPAAHTVGE